MFARVLISSFVIGGLSRPGLAAAGLVSETWQNVSAVIQTTRVTLIALGLVLIGVSGFLLLLRRAVRNRTREVENLLKLQSQFLANMSHEIRTPLNGVVGMIDLAMNADPSDEQRQYLEMGRNSAESLLVVINDILDFSKIEAGKLHVEAAPFELRKVVEKALTPLLYSARMKDLTLISDIDAALPVTLIGDPVRLGQVITNLVGNAIKFTEHGNVLLRGHAVTTTEDSIEVEFSVTDTGIGIPPDRQQSLFQPFSQVDGSLARRHSGAGLGLAISSRLVSLMGGRIWVESAAEQGSRFAFTVRFGVAHGRPAEAAVPIASAAPRSSLAPLWILLAEDNPVNQKVVVGMLEKNRGWYVTPVSNGREAIRALARRPFDIVLMDVHMPEVDGLTAATQIRNERRLDVPIIALTANAMTGDRERCTAAGMDDYVSKPFRREELVSKIESNVRAARESGRNLAATA